MCVRVRVRICVGVRACVRECGLLARSLINIKWANWHTLAHVFQLLCLLHVDYFCVETIALKTPLRDKYMKNCSLFCAYILIRSVFIFIKLNTSAERYCIMIIASYNKIETVISLDLARVILCNVRSYIVMDFCRILPGHANCTCRRFKLAYLL